jgi:hypothetical protein
MELALDTLTLPPLASATVVLLRDAPSGLEPEGGLAALLDPTSAL